MSDCCAPGAKGRNGHYDLAVIGAGSAGFSAAITAADQGANVALIGHGVIGGTCVNIGCVPSKTLIRAAETLHNARAAARFGGIAAEAEVVDWRATIRQKDALVAGLRQAKYVDLLPAYNGIAYREGPARLVEGGVEAGAERILAGKIVIATGARPAIPAIPGVDSLPYLTSTSALDLAELPRLAGSDRRRLCRRGARPDVLPRRRQGDAGLPLPPLAGGGARDRLGADRVFRRRGDRGRFGRCLSFDPQDRKRRGARDRARWPGNIGRSGPGPHRHGASAQHRGPRPQGVRRRALAEERNRRRRPHAHDQGRRLRRRRRHRPRRVRLHGRLWRKTRGEERAERRQPALRQFGDAGDRVHRPAGCRASGSTESDARKAGFDVRVSTIGLDQVPRALAARDTRGLIKLVADAGSRRLLGAHILAPEGADSVQTAALAIRCGLTIDDLAETIFPYLTTVEGLKLAALAFDKNVAKLSCCAG